MKISNVFLFAALISPFLFSNRTKTKATAAIKAATKVTNPRSIVIQKVTLFLKT